MKAFKFLNKKHFIQVVDDQISFLGMDIIKNESELDTSVT